MLHRHMPSLKMQIGR